MKPALVILAAGASSRLGECKALVDLGGRSALERLVAAGACLDAAPPLVITGPDDAAIRARAPASAELLHNPDWAAGRTGGVRLARDARAGCDLALAPVDCPLVPGWVFAALARAWVEKGCPPGGWLGARHGDGPGAHGHPVIVGRELLLGLDELPAGAPLRDLRQAAVPLWALPLAAEVLDDLDGPEDLLRLRRRLAERSSERP